MRAVTLSVVNARKNKSVAVYISEFGKMLRNIAGIRPEKRQKNWARLSRLGMRKFMVFLTFLVCSLALCVPLTVEAVESTPVIYTSTGPVQGEVLSTIVRSVKYSSFRSIRYAEPPRGYDRFKPPTPAKPWTEVLQATLEASACPQINLIIHNYTGSEDCLFINVFTPLTRFDKRKEKGKAVMVWIHGGSYMSGNAKTILYGPDFLIEDDVILVTFNYRVGAFGFLNMYHPNATGNAGIKDQALALHWIKENIEKFGGDVEKITIFGNSAGAALVDLHTLSERSKGLFQGAISISGSLFSSWAIHSRDEAISQGFALGALLGTSTKNEEILLQTLYEATPYEIALKTSKLGEITPPFRPTIEDPSVAGNHAFLTETPLNKYKSGNFVKVPYITGYTAEETSYLITQETIKPITNLANSAISTVDQISASLPINSPALENLLTSIKNGLQQIPNLTLDETIANTSFEYFKAGIDLKQQFLNDQSPEPVYYYQVSFNPPESLHELLYHVISNGTAHADDLAYMFYMPIVNLPLDESHPVSITRRRVVRMWTNFAKYRNPTPQGEADPILRITWPPSGSSGIHLEIDKELSVGPRPVDTRDRYLELIGVNDDKKKRKSSNP